jgi:hypothetical protein
VLATLFVVAAYAGGSVKVKAPLHFFHNNYAWATWVDDPQSKKALTSARLAVELRRRKEASHLHTLAAVLAMNGHPAEAMSIVRGYQGKDSGRTDWADMLVVAFDVSR